MSVGSSVENKILEYEYSVGFKVNDANITTDMAKTWFPNYSAGQSYVPFENVNPDTPELNDGSLSIESITGTSKGHYFVQMDGNKAKIYGSSNGNDWTYFTEITLSATETKLKTSASLHVAGTLDGKLTLICDGDANISGNIHYANTNLQTSNDILGVVSGGNIIIEKSPTSYKEGNETKTWNFSEQWLAEEDSHLNVYGQYYSTKKSNGELNWKSSLDPNGTTVDFWGNVSLDKLPVYGNGSNVDFQWVFHDDPRITEMGLAAPGIPTVKELDPEAGEGATRIKLTIPHGTWSNQISSN
jgi:hypothetical protein